ncbi:hypothetical protein DL96DRAFT_1635713 [Flagelloscypha sp. PMI_526]|nr:hypothetical protein DL96DRAFT_1635713 [Flagelloscypha sp. PMI_526]
MRERPPAKIRAQKPVARAHVAYSKLESGIVWPFGGTFFVISVTIVPPNATMATKKAQRSARKGMTQTPKNRVFVMVSHGISFVNLLLVFLVAGNMCEVDSGSCPWTSPTEGMPTVVI